MIKVRLIVGLAVLVGIMTTANRPPLLGAGKDKKYLYKFLSSSSYILSELAHIATYWLGRGMTEVTLPKPKKQWNSITLKK